MTKQEQTDAVIREWLTEEPQYIAGVRQDEKYGTVMDTDATLAFAEWSIRTGRTSDPVSAKAFLDSFRRRVGK